MVYTRLILHYWWSISLVWHWWSCMALAMVYTRLILHYLVWVHTTSIINFIVLLWSMSTDGFQLPSSPSLKYCYISEWRLWAATPQWSTAPGQIGWNTAEAHSSLQGLCDSFSHWWMSNSTEKRMCNSTDIGGMLLWMVMYCFMMN